MPRQDLEWLFEYGKMTPQNSMTLLGTMQPTSKFGELFQYSNLMAAAAGYTAGHVLYPNMEVGKAYDKGMQMLGVDPLGMSETTFDFEKAQKANHAVTARAGYRWKTREGADGSKLLGHSAPSGRWGVEQH